MKPADVTEDDREAAAGIWREIDNAYHRAGCSSDAAIDVIHIARIAAYEAGRVAGLEEAAEIAAQYSADVWDAIMTAIRALKEKNNG